MGGLGIVMVRRLATSCGYEREGGRNVVRVTKEWAAPGGVPPETMGAVSAGAEPV